MLKKNIFLLFTSLIVILTITGCGGSNIAIEPNVDDVMIEISNQITLPEMADITKDRVDDYYEVDVSTIEDVQLIIAGSGFTPEEILVVKFNDVESAIAFESKMNNRLNQIKTLFENYGSPESADYINDCKIVVKNQYCLFVICEESDTVLKIFNDAFKA